MSSKIKVAILEDQQIIVDGYSFRLHEVPEFEIVGTAYVYSEWEALLAAHSVDVALMDVKVPRAFTDPKPYPILSVMPHLVQTYPETAFLVISAYAEPTLVQGVMQAGASGYILKDDNALLRELQAVLRSLVIGRGIYLSPQAKEQLLQRLPDNSTLGLSPRQLEALTLCAAHPETSIKELATKMHISHSTVRNTLSQTYLRLGVNNRNAAVLKAQELRLLGVK